MPWNRLTRATPDEESPGSSGNPGFSSSPALSPSGRLLFPRKGLMRPGGAYLSDTYISAVAKTLLEIPIRARAIGRTPGLRWHYFSS